ASSGELVDLDGHFGVSSPHKYLEAGTYTITVTIHRGTMTSIGQSAILVKNGALTGIPLTVESNGIGANLVLARFIDSNPNSSVADFRATCELSDGTMRGLYIGRTPGTQDEFDITGLSLDYNTPSDLVIHVSEDDGSRLTINSSVNAPQPS